MVQSVVRVVVVLLGMTKFDGGRTGGGGGGWSGRGA